jgi:transcriptional regulator with XRE-family HTH domain
MLAHPKVLKLARLGLDLSQEDVSTAAKISLRSLQRLEANESSTTTIQTITSVQRALEAYGVIFLGEDETFGSGFRLPRGFLKKIEGAN